MHWKTVRGATALLLVLGLAVATAPVAATPDPAAGGAAVGPSLFDSLKTWVAALWPAPGPDPVPLQAPAWTASENGEDAAARPPASLETGDDPTAEPQIGAEIDPNG